MSSRSVRPAGNRHSCGNTPLAVGAEYPVTLCDLGIFAYQAAQPVPPQDPDIRAHSRRTLTPSRRALAERPVRAVNVIVVDVLTEDRPQVPLAGNQHPVQAFAAGAGNPPLGDRVRPGRSDRGLDDPHADSGEHRVEGRSELGVAVPDQELQAGLRGPSAGSGPAGQPTPPSDGP